MPTSARKSRLRVLVSCLAGSALVSGLLLATGPGAVAAVTGSATPATAARPAATGAQARPAAPAAPAAAAAASCQVTYAVNSDWGTGFSVAVTITNTGPAITSWTLGYSYAGNQQLSSGWSGTWTQSGENISVASASWNGSLATGASASIGANFSYTGTNKAPTAFTLNGTTCNGGGTGPGTINVALTSPASGATYTAP
ncbi:MAG TPA: cellulose binding domain-containing protein, partial [Streptosporangiaceae bacterium]|nr:cellulose binding domain-containing protein [Streptosporangiaceae bacterium]